MSHQDCCNETLASSAVGHVTACRSCGQVHLSLQFMTVRLDEHAFRTLATMLGQAHGLLDGGAGRSAAGGMTRGAPDRPLH